MNEIPHLCADYLTIVKDVFPEDEIETSDDISVETSNGSNEGDNYMGNLYRISLILKSNESKFVKLMLKMIPTGSELGNVLPAQDFFMNEMHVYNKILPAFEELQDVFSIPERDRFKYAKCYRATDTIVLMEDLNVSGFKMHKRQRYFDLNHLRLVIGILSRFHALSFAMKEHHPEKMTELSRYVKVINLSHSGCAYVEAAAFKVVSVIDDDYKRKKMEMFSKKLLTKYKAYCDPDTYAPYNVICHTDCWNNNILFKYENDKPTDVRLIDWQTIKYCSPINDLVYTVLCNTEISMRDEDYKNILEFYYDNLGHCLSNFKCDIEQCFPRRIFERHLKEFSIFTLNKLLMVFPLIKVDSWKDHLTRIVDDMSILHMI